MSRTRGIRCFSLIVAAAAVGAMISPVSAQTPTTPQQQSAPREHVVKKGDTLWDLAQFYYGNPYLWKIIFNANRPVVENPHWIYPVERLIIPGRDTLVEPALGTAVPVQVTVEPVQAPKDTTPPTVLGTVDLRRALVSASEYERAPWLSPAPRPSIVARLVRVADPTVNSDKIPQQLMPNNRVLLGELSGSFNRGDSLQLVRIGRAVDTYGQIVEPIGMLRVDSVGATVVSATLVRQFGIARVGDYVMPVGPAPVIPRGEYTPVDAGAETKIVEFLNTRTMHGTGDVGFIGMGSDQLRIGDELAVYTPEQKIDDERPDMLPKTTVGVVRVIKVTDHSATVRVTGVRNTGLQNGLPARLIRRAP